MDFPTHLKYTEDHEWLEEKGDRIVIGITHYAVEELGEIVYVELPSVGTRLSPHGVVATVESVKAVAEVYTPVGGEVVEVNEELKEQPHLISTDPYGEGWIAVLKIKGGLSQELLTAEQYRLYVEGLKKK